MSKLTERVISKLHGRHIEMHPSEVTQMLLHMFWMSVHELNTLTQLIMLLAHYLCKQPD